MEDNNIKSKEELERKVDETMKERLDEVRERMKRRKEVFQKNEGVTKKIKLLEAQRRMEEKIEEKIRSKRRARGRG